MNAHGRTYADERSTAGIGQLNGGRAVSLAVAHSLRILQIDADIQIGIDLRLHRHMDLDYGNHGIHGRNGFHVSLKCHEDWFLFGRLILFAGHPLLVASITGN